MSRLDTRPVHASLSAQRSRPTTLELFNWAVGRDAPTIAQAAKRFACAQKDIEDTLDSLDGGEPLPVAQYLGLGVALRNASGIAVLKGGDRIIEAYYNC